LTEFSGLDQHSDFPPSRGGMVAELAMIANGKMFSMKMEEIADRTLA
jgi:hypothetical protein